jgi:hypothetical protein
MAIFMGNNVHVKAGATTITTFVSSVSLSREVDAVEITAMTNTVQNLLGGIERPSVSLELYNDFAASSVNGIFEDALGTKLALELIPGTVSATNPRYSMSVLVSQWQPINGTLDGPATASITLPVTALTKATS